MSACRANQHMTCRQYGLWTRIRELQSKFGFVYFDGDSVAGMFSDTSRDTIFRECTALINAGWFRLRSERQRKKDGTWEARKIVAVTHAEWLKTHLNACLPVAPVQLGMEASSRTGAIDQSHGCDIGFGSNQASNKKQESKQGVTGVTCASENLSDKAKIDNYLQEAVRAPRSSDFCWTPQMMEQIKQDLRGEPSFERIWRGDGEWSTAGYSEPGKRDWAALRMLGGLVSGSQPERWEKLFEILKDTMAQHDVEDSGRLFSIATQTILAA